MSLANQVNPKAAVGYCRVSTEKQAERGVSLESQTEKIRAMATIHGAELVDVIVDAGESAKNTDRPGLRRVLALVESGAIQTIIVAKLDRLTRSVRDLADLLELLNKRNVSLVSISESLDTGSAGGRLVLNIMTAVSQWEREAIGERTQTALRHKKAHRRVFNHVPYGFTREGEKLVPDAHEQAVACRIRLCRSNRWSLRKIADALNADAVPTKHGKRWFAETVRNVLESGMMESHA